MSDKLAFMPLLISEPKKAWNCKNSKNCLKSELNRDQPTGAISIKTYQMPHSVEKVVDEWPGDGELCCGDEGGSQIERLDLLQQSGVVLTGGNRQKGVPVHDAGLGQASHPENP